MMTKAERSWVLYDWANSAYTLAIEAALLPVFFKTVAAAELPKHASTAWWGYANTAAGLCIAAAAPVLGAIADARGLKKRLFAAFFALGTAATAVLATVGAGQWQRCLVVYGVSLVGHAGANIFYDAFLVDVTDDSRLHWMSACGYAWGYIGSTLPFALGLCLILRPSLVGAESPAGAMRFVFLITAAWWALFTIPIFRNVRQVHGVELSATPVRDAFRRLRGTFGRIRRHRNVFVLLIAYFLYIDGVDTVAKMAGVYGADIGISSGSLLTVLLVVQVVAFPFALLYGRLARHVPVKALLLFAIGVYVLVCIYAYWLQTVLQFWILAIIVGMNQGGVTGR